MLSPYFLTQHYASLPQTTMSALIPSHSDARHNVGFIENIQIVETLLLDRMITSSVDLPNAPICSFVSIFHVHSLSS